MSHAVSKAIEWRIRALIGDRAVDNATIRLGRTFRAFAKRDKTFLGIAGSAGKTTAKELLLEVLAEKGKAVGNRKSLNRTTDIANIVLRMRPWHRYCVAELGETGPDSLDELLTVLQPSIGIVTVIGDDHLSAFGSREAVAREFAKLAQAIPPEGTLVLNNDDAPVSALRHRACCRIITYGTTPGADLLADDIVSAWPEPLQFVATFKGERVAVRTQLTGRQLLTSALAAIGGGLAAGLTLDECARGIARAVPAEGRMQSVRCADDITFIRDDFKAPAWTVKPLLEQLGEARARRKIFVLGTISDCRDTPTQILKAARHALDVADIAIFTGRFASAALKARGPETVGRLHAFSHTLDVAAFLQSTRQPGDLIVLKGTNKKDHLSRLVLSQSQAVNCWVDDCGRDMFCSECSHVRSKRSPGGVIDALPAAVEQTVTTLLGMPAVPPGGQVIVGLGNPGSEYVGTPHNAGYQAIDELCTALGGTWTDYPEAWLAPGQLGDHAVWLIKAKSPMNLTGPALKRLAKEMQFDAGQCVLVFDDIDLPLGKTRIRMNGSAGGHRGVASILDAFQTDRFRRIKIGVKPAVSGADLTQYVLTPMAAEEALRLAHATGEIVRLTSAILSASPGEGNRQT